MAIDVRYLNGTFNICGKFDRTDSNAFYNEIMELGMAGLSLKQCGDFYAQHPEDWAEWCEEHPLTEARLACGKAKAQALAGSKLTEQIQAGKINAIIFYLKTMGGFTEKSIMEIEQAIKVAHQVPTVPIDPIEAARVYQNFIREN